MQDALRDFEEGARTYHTDKSKACGMHDYAPAYAELLHPLRYSARCVFEIGIGSVENGQMSGVVKQGYRSGGGMRLWRDFFPAAHIVGMDIYAHPELCEARMTAVQGDQSCAADLRRTIAAFGRPMNEPFLDVVVDDGSHRWQDQAFSFLFLHTWVVVGGVYAIEDVQPDGAARFADLSVFPAHFRKHVREHFRVQYFDTRKSNCREDDLIVAFTRIAPEKHAF
jgi:hypothetical protein